MITMILLAYQTFGPRKVQGSYQMCIPKTYKAVQIAEARSCGNPGACFVNSCSSCSTQSGAFNTSVSQRMGYSPTARTSKYFQNANGSLGFTVLSCLSSKKEERISTVSTHWILSDCLPSLANSGDILS